MVQCTSRLHVPNHNYDREVDTCVHIYAGFLIAAPVGPVGILCIRKALADGRSAAFIAGLGAAFADTFYGAVAALGISVVSQFIDGHQTMVRLIGGVMLLYIGWTSLRTETLSIDQDDYKRNGLIKDFLSTFVITLTNPATILAFFSVFATISSLGMQSGHNTGWVLVFGVFVGSSLWWLVLSGTVAAIRTKFSPVWLAWTNKTAGILLIGSGAALLISLL